MPESLLRNMRQIAPEIQKRVRDKGNILERDDALRELFENELEPAILGRTPDRLQRAFFDFR